MVRIKHRYLLVNILYPPIEQTQSPHSSSSAAKKAGVGAGNRLHLQTCRPTPDFVTPALLARMIRDAVGELYGDWGMGKLGGAGAGALNVKYFSPATSTAIVRCPRESYRLVWSAMTYISRLPAPKGAKPHQGERGRGQEDSASMQRECVFRVVRVSGTIKMAELEAMKRARTEVVKAMKMGEEGGADVLEGMFGGQTAGGIESDDGEEEKGDNGDDDESEG